MPQISLYVDEEVLKKVEAAAKLENKSISKWVSSKLQASLVNQWPEEYFNIFGQMADDSFNEPTEIDFIDEVPKESL